MFTSKGFKRLIASALLAITGVLQAIPGGVVFIAVLTAAAGIFGAAGIIHAVPAKTLNKKILASIAAVLAILVQIVPYIPILAPYQDLLLQLAQIIGAMAAGTFVPELQKELQKKKK